MNTNNNIRVVVSAIFKRSSNLLKLFTFCEGKFIENLFKILFVIIIFVIFITLILFPIYIGMKYGQLPSVTEYWIQYISVFLSSFSFGAVILTLWIQHKDEKQQQEQIKKNFEFAQHNYDSQILDKIHFFTSDSMAKCRGGACRLWYQLDKDPDIREKVLEYFIMTITNTEGENEGIENEQFYKDFSDFFKLIRYFNVMSFYSFNNITANAVHYYYVYYRRFFKDMIDIYKQAYESIEESKKATTVRENWIYLVEKMDAIMTDNNLPLE